MSKTKDVVIRGFTRLQITDKKTGKVIGDTGYLKNTITNYGFANCLVASPIKATGSIQVAGILLGSSGDAIATNATKLGASLSKYYSTVAISSVVASLTARLSASFDGTLDAVTLKEVGLLSVSNGSLICGNTFASSALATTQDVNVTYELRYSRV